MCSKDLNNSLGKGKTVFKKKLSCNSGILNIPQKYKFKHVYASLITETV